MKKYLFDRLEQRNRVEEIEQRRARLEIEAFNYPLNVINRTTNLNINYKPSVASMQSETFEQHVYKPFIRPEGHVSNCAISLSWLLDTFLKKHPEIRSKSMTTGSVTYSIIKPAVQENGCRYVDMISDESAVSRGRRFFFISHGWGRPFIELIEQLKAHFTKPELYKDVFVWLDVFAITQCEGAKQGDDLSQLKEVVQDAEQTLMIVDKDGTVLSRIWCL